MLVQRESDILHDFFFIFFKLGYKGTGNWSEGRRWGEVEITTKTSTMFRHMQFQAMHMESGPDSRVNDILD